MPRGGRAAPRPGEARRSPSCPSGAHTGSRGTSTGRSPSRARCRPARGGGPVGRRTEGSAPRGQFPIRLQRGRGRAGRRPRDPTHGRLRRDRGPEPQPLRPSTGEVCGGQPAAAGAVDGNQGAVAPADSCGPATPRTGLPGGAPAGTRAVLFLAAEWEAEEREPDRRSESVRLRGTGATDPQRPASTPRRTALFRTGLFEGPCRGPAD